MLIFVLPLHAYRECHVDTTTIQYQWQVWAVGKKWLWLCSSSLTHAVHILTRSLSGETEFVGMQTNSKMEPKKFSRIDPPTCLFWQPVSHSSKGSFHHHSTETRMWHTARSHDLAVSPLFGLHRHNCTRLGSAICDIRSPKRQSRVPTLRQCGKMCQHILTPYVW